MGKTMKLVSVAAVLMFSLLARAEGQISLDECIRLAREHYPQAKEMLLADKTEQSDLKINRQKWAPQLVLNGKASYQSEVVEMPFDFNGYDFDISNYQYSLTADVDQMIWDGGETQNKKRQISADADVKRRQLDVTLYNLNDRVENFYLSVLLLDRQLAQKEILMQSLQRNRKEVEACLESGVAYKSDLDIVEVNILDCEQSVAELKNDRQAYVAMLELLTGRSFDGVEFAEPSTSVGDDDMVVRRPELSLYNAQAEQLKLQREGLQARLSPKFNFYLQGGLGKPGLNMLKDEIRPYYVAGIKMQWNFGALYSRKNDIRKMEIQQENIEYERETFLLNTSLDVTEQMNSIRKIKDALGKDSEIIRLRERIRQAGEEQYRSGVIKMTDLMTMIDDEHNARVNESLHQVQLMKAVRKLKNIVGE